MKSGEQIEIFGKIRTQGIALTQLHRHQPAIERHPLHMGPGFGITHTRELQRQPHRHPQTVDHGQFMGHQRAHQFHMGLQLPQQLRREQPRLETIEEQKTLQPLGPVQRHGVGGTPALLQQPIAVPTAVPQLHRHVVDDATATGIGQLPQGGNGRQMGVVKGEIGGAAVMAHIRAEQVVTGLIQRESDPLDPGNQALQPPVDQGQAIGQRQALIESRETTGEQMGHGRSCRRPGLTTCRQPRQNTITRRILSRQWLIA